MGPRTAASAQTGKCAQALPERKGALRPLRLRLQRRSRVYRGRKTTTNTFFDIAASTVDLGLVEMLVDGIGADRVLFGTDLPFLDCRMQIGRMAFSG